MANRVTKYLKNVDKELKDITGTQSREGSAQQFARAKGNANITKLPNGKTIKKGLSEKQAAAAMRKERGEFFGALLQGRRYDAQGKQIKKTASKPATKVTPKVGMKEKSSPLSKSERDFLAGQKLKAKITKRTGVYPNTAN